MYLGNVRLRKFSIIVLVGIFILWYLYTIRKSELDGKQTISMKDLLNSAIKASEIGGLQIVAVHENPNLIVESKGKTKEGINDPVTAADYRSHCAMYKSLTNAFPMVTVISEEKSIGCDDRDIINIQSYNSNLQDLDDISVDVNDITVWIDPLDATKEFTENLLHFVTTMVCIAYKGEPIIGVIHKPFQPKATYWAWVEHGTSDNLKLKSTSSSRINVSLHNSVPINDQSLGVIINEQYNLNEWLMTTGHSLVQVLNQSDKHIDKETPVLIVSQSHAGSVKNVSRIAFGDDVKVTTAAGAGYKVLEIVFGNASAYVHMTTIKKWDICAGSAILSSLGGKMTSLFDSEKITFKADDSTVLRSGLLATMRNHDWYLNKFLKS